MTKKYYNSCPSYPNSFLRPDFTIRKSTSFVSVSSLCNLFIFLSRALCGCETFSNVTGRLVLGWVQEKITTLMKFKIKHDTGFKQARKRFQPISARLGFHGIQNTILKHRIVLKLILIGNNYGNLQDPLIIFTIKYRKVLLFKVSCLEALFTIYLQTLYEEESNVYLL